MALVTSKAVLQIDSLYGRPKKILYPLSTMELVRNRDRIRGASRGHTRTSCQKYAASRV